MSPTRTGRRTMALAGRAALPAAALLAMTVLLARPAGADSAAAIPGMILTWSDEFDGPAGQSPDPAKWRFDIGTVWGNEQLEYDTERPENVSLDGEGHLAITARREEYEGQPYTSGRINTHGLFAQEEGRFSARIRLPTGAGIWPAFWLLGDDFEEVGWPACGEIDIMEFRGQEPRVLHASVHGPGYAGGECSTARYEHPHPLDDGFHVFTLTWSAQRMTWFVDGKAIRTVAPWDLPDGTEWAFARPHFVILDVAVGGGFVGPPDESTVFPQTMLVDWVRVYRRGD